MKASAIFAAVAAALLSAISAPARAQTATTWQPNAVFVQGGAGRHVNSAAVGLTWDWRWQRDSAIGTLTGYTELDLARWRTSGRAHDAGFDQLGIVPVLRLYPRALGIGWFVEAGVGASAISPRYRNDTLVFSTVFNFGDHVGVGRRFGAQEANEVSLRFEHFSNAGIKKPNPGENFMQLRHTHRF